MPGSPPLSPLSPLPCFCGGHAAPLNHTLGTRLDEPEDSAGAQHKAGSVSIRQRRRESGSTARCRKEEWEMFTTEPPPALGRDWSCLAPASRDYDIDHSTTILVPALHSQLLLGRTPPPWSHGNLACSRLLLHIVTLPWTNS